MKRSSALTTVFLLIFQCIISSTVRAGVSGDSAFLALNWKKVATQMPGEWYGSMQAKSVAENVLFAQSDFGGWAKNKPYHHPFSQADSTEVLKVKSGEGATFDNGATILEMRFLSKIHTRQPDERYRKAFEKGLQYILEAQYENGGWPQFYPSRKGKTVRYAAHITYNDNAMVNTMNLLKEISSGHSAFNSLAIGNDMKERAKSAFDKGVDCILNTQIKVKGQPTVWCAQHDEVTLAPANARAYELASFSGSESAGITLLLMELDRPSERVKQAIRGSVTWFKDHKITGFKLDNVADANGKKNVVLVKDESAPPMWARFYDLETAKPFFCDRDGVKKSSIAEIGPERRNGYAWYTNSPEKVIKNYDAWVKRTS